MPLNKLEIIQSRIRPELPISMIKIKKENVPYLDTRVLVEYMRQEIKVNGVNNRKTWESYKASKDEIITDIELDDVIISSPELQNNLKLRSTAGHAREGHVYFKKENGGPGPKPNTTLEDIISDRVLQELVDENDQLLYRNRNEYLEETQEKINDVAKFLVNCVNSYKKSLKPIDSTGNPLLGIDFLKEFQVNPQAVLKGYFFGAFFDNYDEIRKEVEQKFQVNYGGGETYLANIKLIKKAGVHLTEFTTNNYIDEIIQEQPHNKKIKIFKDADLIINVPEPDTKRKTWSQILEEDGIDLTKSSTNFIQQYIRTKSGRGGADDVLVRLAAFIDFNEDYKNKTAEWYNGLQLGAQLADIVDTLEKATKYFVQGGQDEVLGKFINNLWLEKTNDRTYRNIHNINLKDIKNKDFALVDKNQIIYLTALGINPKREQIHSSVKYFLKYQEMNIPNTQLNTNKKLTFKNAQELKDFMNSTSIIDTTAIEQEFLYMQKKLESLGCNMRNYNGQMLSGNLCPNSDVLIGFKRTPFKEFVSYMDNQVIPYAHKMSLKPEKEKEEFLKAVIN